MGVASFPWAASSADGLMSLKVGGVLGYLVRGSRLGGEGGFTLPRGIGGRQFWLDGLGIHGHAGDGVRQDGMFVCHLRRFQYDTYQ